VLLAGRRTSPPPCGPVDLPQAAEACRRLQAGTVFVSGYGRADFGVPFGGHRESGTGVDRSLHALRKYSRLKTTWMHWTRDA
jgi:4-(gamma-glutamylamino)butanal dehydrogenase